MTKFSIICLILCSVGFALSSPAPKHMLQMQGDDGTETTLSTNIRVVRQMPPGMDQASQMAGQAASMAGMDPGMMDPMSQAGQMGNMASAPEQAMKMPG